MLADLPQNWRWMKFEEILKQPLRNGIYKKKEFHGRGCKVINMGELFANPRIKSGLQMKRVELTSKELEKSVLKEGDLIFARRSLTAEGAGKCCVILSLDEPTTFESSIIRARLNQEVASPEFYFYLFNSPFGKWLLGTILRQVAVSGITGSDLAKLEVPVPPRDVQDQIVDYGRNLDDKIELNRQINTTLESMAQALFKSWFVDFDPVIDNALAAGHPIPEALQARAERRRALRENPQQPLPAKIQQLFPSSFVFSEEMGWIPEGWDGKLIKEFVEVTDYVANGSFAALKQNVTLYDDSEYALYVRTTDFKNNFSQEKAKYVDRDSYSFLKKTVLTGDEVIISNVGDTGTVFRPPVWMNRPMTLGSNAIALRSENMGNFLHLYFESDFGQHQISGIVGGSAQPKFNKTDFRALKVYFGSKEIVAAFESRVSSLRNKECLNKAQIDQLEQLRNSLLPKLLSGQIQIPEAEQQLADVI
ncbi:restriction endonuclease subunit S [Microbulbifer hydrolyticus]|uniref:Restriction endonuclease subunit S n=1 Tax=Microbulbifer hydrolyticus TaxID=48074 RepID=A0A6P1TCN6_9GAMM|nr:restriction endonuclease subunit S [Microbulbifer hydrolyticus]MBB5211886.1 type I restriction enzyme S subunit [Microbulbifer hydrolyticus]QHQ40528.1 restriction endonuclease subunit S [Microbulbifer hydrolyticus]